MEKTRREVIETLENPHLSAKIKNLTLDKLVKEAQGVVVDHYQEVMEKMLKEVKQSPEKAAQIIHKYSSWELLDYILSDKIFMPQSD